MFESDIVKENEHADGQTDGDDGLITHFHLDICKFIEKGIRQCSGKGSDRSYCLIQGRKLTVGFMECI